MVESALEQLEKDLSLIKSEFKQKLLEREQKHQEIMRRTKTVVEEIVGEYKQKLSSKQQEIDESKGLSKQIIEEYDSLLKQKDFQIRFLEDQLKLDEASFQKLKKSGIPEALLHLPKHELIEKTVGMARENSHFLREIETLKKNLSEKEEDHSTTTKVMEENTQKLALEYSNLFDKNRNMESEITVLNEKIAFLINELNHNPKIMEIKAEYEAKINDLIAERAKEQVEYEAVLSTLQNQLQDANRMLREKEEDKRIFMMQVEEKIKDAVMPIVSNYASSMESRVYDNKIYSSVKEAMESGDSKDKIILDLLRKGYSKEEILNAIRIMK